MTKKIALLGYGTIGSGVYDLINIQKKYPEFEIIKVLERKEKILNNDKNIFTSNYEDILNDKNIEIVIEVMGTNDFSYNCMKKALQNKKHVITANKEVVSIYLDELLDLANKNNVTFLFEASVGGGIPIIGTTIETARESKIEAITGILNGTTNFILTKMQKDGLKFEEALKISQDLGFCEKDPTNDLEGYDMMRKILILSRLAYHARINISDVSHYGIKGINDLYIKYLKENHFILKYICCSKMVDDEVMVTVSPYVYKESDLISHIDYENNYIELIAFPNDTLSFIGKGAGKYPTSAAIIRDLYHISNNNPYLIDNIDNKVNINNEMDNNLIYLVQKNNKIYKTTNKNELIDATFYALIEKEE